MPAGALAGTGAFRSLRVRNFRLYFVGQGLSMCGTWAQRVAQDWLVLTLTHSGTALGLVVAAQFGPILAAGPFAGLVVDRMDKRRLVIVTQALLALQALALGMLTVLGVVQVWMVFVLAVTLGALTALDTPGRQSLLMELVGAQELRNAASLNAVQVSVANAVGPAAAAALIATTGLGGCFLANAATFTAVIGSLLRMDARDLQRTPPVTRAGGQIREGLHYVLGTRTLFTPLFMIAAISALAYEFPVVLPVLASSTFGAGPTVYGAMTTAVGIGAVASGLVLARGTGAPPIMLVSSALAFSLALLAAAAAPSVALEFIALLAVGAAMMWFFSLGNLSLQLNSLPAMRGRVMSLWAMAYMGMIPLGGPVVGLVTQHAGPRWAFVLGAAAAAACAVFGALSLLRPAKVRA
jgi:MFS family permease